MARPEKIHVELWTKGFFPLVFFKALLEKELEAGNILYHFEEEKSLSWVLRSRSEAQLSIVMTPLFYTDYVHNGKGDSLYKILLKGLQLLSTFESSLDPDGKVQWLNLRKNKYEFTYECSDQLPLHFSFKSNWTEIEEKAAYDSMINYIRNYEAEDDEVHAQIESTLADIDQIRFFFYDTWRGVWMIQDHLSDLTLHISKDYLHHKKDARVAKPDILINEDKFSEYFVWDQQWTLMLEKFQVIMARPNDVALYLSLMDRNLTKAKSFLEDAIERRNKSPFYNMMLDNESTIAFYDYFETIVSAIIFSYTAIETLANTCIEEGYEYTKRQKGTTTIYDKEGIERYFKLREKFKTIIRDILKTPDPSSEPWWQLFIQLEDIRNEIIHTKQSKSEERYSELLSKKIFPIVEVSKTIVEYYGNHINAKLRRVLMDIPFGYGFDNTLPCFMTNDEYWKQNRRLYGIPDPPETDIISKL